MQILWSLIIYFVLPQVAVDAVAAGRAPAATPSSLVLVQMSDIHYGNEEYVPMAWHEAWGQAQALKPHAVLFTGDQADNKCSPEEFTRRLKGIVGEMAPRVRALGRPAMIALGNNDVAKNYQTDPDNLLASIRIYREGLGDLFYLDDLGNGTYPEPVAGMTWITFNSLIFSPANSYAGRDQQAKQTFDWLERTLQGLPADRPVVLVTHIPPTIDLYDSKPAWRPEYLERFKALVREYPEPMLMVAGHFHRNEVHAITTPRGVAIPILVAGSLSFKYGNFPNWRSYAWTLGSGGHMTALAYRIRYPGHDDWSSRWSFASPQRSGSWVSFINKLADAPASYARYMRDLYAHNEKWKTWADAAGARLKMLEQIWGGSGAVP